jgi:hypothetical protein
MKLKNTQLRVLKDGDDLSKSVKTGVSLHCHTQFSKEMLDFVPHYAEKLPIISHFWKKEQAKYIEREGKPINFETAYWSPPLSEKEVFRLEREQIESLGINPIVSITDHDNIEANMRICEHTPNEVAPISLEWTVPFQYGFFHLGVHNLPHDTALEISKNLLDYTFSKEEADNKRLHELFAMLNGFPEVLVILNHPLWDIEMVGKERHEVLLKNFLYDHGKWIHALEINGFRAWSENKAVIEIAESIGIPICTGGDRHGCKPNTVLNLTNASSFAEFVNEVRVDKHTDVALMPEYTAPLHSRQLQSFSEILKNYEEFPPERVKWFDRIFFDGDGKGLRPLSQYGWRLGGPKWLRMAIWTLGFLGNPKLRPAYRLLRKREDVVPEQMTSELFLTETEYVLPESDKLIAENR